ncbi:MAG: hypothetical protein K5656_00945 [Lachnospiraceae bacterium]|nr:hypothetical protein [Lachnospiraceae bacterium]
MKTMKKLMACALAFCLAFAGVLSASSFSYVANAAEPAGATIEGFSVVNEQNTYYASLHCSVQAYIATVKVSAKNIATVGKYEKMNKTVDGQNAIVTVNPTKDTYFAVKAGDVTKYFKLEGSSTKKWYPVVTYDSNTGTPKVGVSSTKKGTAIVSTLDSGEALASCDAGKIEKVAEIIESSETLYYGVVHQYNASANAVAKDVATIKGTDTKIDCTIVGTAVSKMVKIKVAKRANAPSAAVNYVKGTVTVPKGCAYRVVSQDGTEIVKGTASFEGSADLFDATSAASAKKTVDLTAISADAGFVEVVKKAANKRATKVRAIPFSKGVTSADAISVTTKDGKNDKVTATLENKAGVAYEYKNANKKWVKIAAGKKATYPGLTAGDKISVRVQGNNTLMTIAGDEATVTAGTAKQEVYVSADAVSADAEKSNGKIIVTVCSKDAAGKVTVLKVDNDDFVVTGNVKASLKNGVATLEGLKKGDYTLKFTWSTDNAKKYKAVADKAVTVNENEES